MVGVGFEADSEALDTTGIVFFVFVRVRPMAESQVRLIKFSVALGQRPRLVRINFYHFN